MPNYARLATLCVPAALVAFFTVTGNGFAQRPLPAIKTPVRAQGQLVAVRDTYERRPLSISKVDGSQTPNPGDYGSLVLSARALVTFCLPDQLELDPKAEVVFGVSGTESLQPYKPVKPLGRFPNSDQFEFENVQSPSLRSHLSVRFRRPLCTYTLTLVGFGETNGNTTTLKHVRAMEDFLFTITVFDDAKKVAYIGRTVVRVVENNDRK